MITATHKHTLTFKAGNVGALCHCKVKHMPPKMQHNTPCMHHNTKSALAVVCQHLWVERGGAHKCRLGDALMASTAMAPLVGC